MEKSLEINFLRGEKLESVHRIHGALCSAEGQLMDSWGDPHYESYWRSGAKPFQIVPVLLRGGREKFSLKAEDIAVMSSSHNGELRHVERVLSLLKRAGVDEDMLECNPAHPLLLEAAFEVARKGEAFRKVHHCCSGKHTGMILLAQLMEVEEASYRKSGHPVQVEIKNAIARSIDFPSDYIEIGIDGCGVPVFWMSISSMARAYAKLAAPEKAYLAEDLTEALNEIREAMKKAPFFVAGSNRFETELMEATNGEIVAKFGNEGIFCMAHSKSAEGLVLKVEDGSFQAMAPAALALARQLGWISEEIYGSLWERELKALKNHWGEQVGGIQAILSI